VAGELQEPMSRIAALLEYVRTHLDTELNVGLLAQRAGFSTFHFQRIFRVAVGETIADYVRRLRLQRAAIRLRSDDAPITEIALGSGYETPSAFARAFTNAYGRTPSAFRAEADASPLVEHAMNVVFETMPRRRLLGMPHVGPYSRVPVLWARFTGHLRSRGLLEGAQLVGLSYDDPETTDLEALRYEACVVSDEAADESLATIEIDGGRYAVYRHVGPYELIGHAFDRLIEHLIFVERLDVRDAPCMEFYRNDPTVAAPGELVTDLAVPVV